MLDSKLESRLEGVEMALKKEKYPIPIKPQDKSQANEQGVMHDNGQGNGQGNGKGNIKSNMQENTEKNGQGNGQASSRQEEASDQSNLKYPLWR